MKYIITHSLFSQQLNNVPRPTLPRCLETFKYRISRLGGKKGRSAVLGSGQFDTERLEKKWNVETGTRQMDALSESQ
jgi:hypothetical protein